MPIGALSNNSRSSLSFTQGSFAPSAAKSTQPPEKTENLANDCNDVEQQHSTKFDGERRENHDEKQYKEDSKHEESVGEVSSDWKRVCKSFDDMKLSENLLRGIYSYGFEKPSPIQQRGIEPMLTGRDCIVQAQSGMGKTGTFTLATLQMVDASIAGCQALILAPTRELARQTKIVASCLGDYLKVNVHACVGGTRMYDDKAGLRNAHIVVGTPGRIKHMLEEGHLNTRHLKLAVLDEADEMLSRGFLDQIYEIFQLLPKDIQIGLFSATMPDEALEVSERFMRNPIRILVKNEAVTLEGIAQYYVFLEHDRYKLECLCDLYGSLTITQAVIFVNTRRRAEWLADQMNDRDFTVSCIHSDLSSEQRTTVMQEFRTGSSRVLIATDLIGRGIDVQQVSLVINYDLPRLAEQYIHRIGRTGRLGKKGSAISLVTERDTAAVRELEQFYNTQIEALPNNLDALNG